MKKYWWQLVSNDKNGYIDSKRTFTTFSTCISDIISSLDVKVYTFKHYTIKVFKGDYHKYGFENCELVKEFNEATCVELLREVVR